MKRITIVFVMLIVGSYFVYSAYNARIEKQDRQRKETADAELIQKNVLTLVERNGAIDDWDVQIAENETVKVTPVMTIDLERLWIQDKPIMFSGTISDIKSHDVKNYTVTIDRNIISSVFFVRAELKLELIAEKALIDSFLDKWPQVKGGSVMDDGVVVIARINSVQSEVSFVGKGDLIDITYSGSVPF